MTIVRFGKVIELNKNTEFFVGKCGSGNTVFGERAHFTKATKQHFVFTTESGAIVKTDMCMNTVGKAQKAHYWVGFGDRTNDDDGRIHDAYTNA